MQQRTKVVAAVAALAVTAGVVVAVTIGGRDDLDPDPTPTDPGVTEPVVVTPVEPDPTTDPSVEPTQDPLEERDLEASGDGDAEEYLPESVWVEAEHEGPVRELDNHEHAEDTTEQWMPVVEGFAAELADVDRPHEQWHQAIAPYLSDRLAEAYADPYTQATFTSTVVDEVLLVYTGETTGRVLVRFENFRMDMYLTVGPSLSTPSGWEITSVEAP
ncbi:hypothetical protein [Pseudactinotalea terrae]|uniref:hypothetical protein n=1 Tax=Pseudactinotalea terrae TaxID=1743262 RepID=UPI0012E1ABEC|nr:hypothetical protein [Pseudactinotalea terrae]